jgi:hypothetical protein
MEIHNGFTPRHKIITKKKFIIINYLVDSFKNVLHKNDVDYEVKTNGDFTEIVLFCGFYKLKVVREEWDFVKINKFDPIYRKALNSCHSKSNLK